jgi:hypothetical protein
MHEYFNTSVGRRHSFLLYGIGGVGKSQIAFKFVQESEARCGLPSSNRRMQTEHFFRFANIYFIDSGSRQTIENDLVTLARAQRIGDTAQDALLWLSHQHKEWLLVFNNADDVHLNLIQFFPSSSHGNIIITSRNPDLAQHAESTHKVEAMDIEDAIDLLLVGTRYDVNASGHRQIARQIVQVLNILLPTLLE